MQLAVPEPQTNLDPAGNGRIDQEQGASKSEPIVASASPGGHHDELVIKFITLEIVQVVISETTDEDDEDPPPHPGGQARRLRPSPNTNFR